MDSYRIEINNIKGLNKLDVAFEFHSSNLIVLTGKNGAGKTTLAKALALISDPQVFDKTSSLYSIHLDSYIKFEFDGYGIFSFIYNKKLNGLDTRDVLPPKHSIISELPIPYGKRFQQFTLVAQYDSDIRANIASSDYREATKLKDFFSDVYPSDSHRFSRLQVTTVRRKDFYFILQPNDYYIREDHFSSGEFFLIQLYRLITSGAELIVIDEMEVSLDASAQVHLIDAIAPLLEEYNSKIILISHSLAFMKTAGEGCLYYLEKSGGRSSLERRSFGYVKSDLYGFKGKDRYIITEDKVLEGFINFIIRSYCGSVFFEYEIIGVGGQPQIESMIEKNDEYEIFAPSSNVLVVIDADIEATIRKGYTGETKICISPVDDIELFIWKNKDRLLPNVHIDAFKHAKKEKKIAKTYWKKLINSEQKRPEDLYKLVVEENQAATDRLTNDLKTHLTLGNL